MRYFVCICLSLFFLPIPVNAIKYRPMCNALGSEGHLMITDPENQKQHDFDIAGDAVFDPDIFHKGLYAGFFVAKGGKSNLIYMYIHPELPAGFITIFRAFHQGRTVVTINWHEPDHDMHVTHVGYGPLKAEFPYYHDLSLKELSFPDELFSLEITGSMNQQPVCITRLFVNQKSGLDVFDSETQHIITPVGFVVGAAPTQTAKKEPSPSLFGSIAQRVDMFASRIFGENAESASSSSSSSQTAYENLKRKLQDKEIFNRVGWGLGRERPVAIEIGDKHINVIFSGGANQALTLTLPENGRHAPKISFNSRITQSSRGTHAKFYVREQGSDVNLAILNGYFEDVIHDITFDVTGDFVGHDIYFQQEPGKSYVLYFASDPATHETVKLQIKDLIIE